MEEGALQRRKTCSQHKIKSSFNGLSELQSIWQTEQRSKRPPPAPRCITASQANYNENNPQPSLKLKKGDTAGARNEKGTTSHLGAR